MKVLINIDEYQFEHCKRHAKEKYANWLEEAVANGQPIPNNATNGDVIKAMFPELEIANDSLSYDNLAYIMAYFGGYKTGLVRGSNSFERTWWDAPYKGGE